MAYVPSAYNMFCNGIDIPVLHHNTDNIFHFLWDHCAHCGIFENAVLLMYTLEAVNSIANFITAYEESHSICNMFFVSKGVFSDFYSTTSLWKPASMATRVNGSLFHEIKQRALRLVPDWTAMLAFVEDQAIATVCEC